MRRIRSVAIGFGAGERRQRRIELQSMVNRIAYRFHLDGSAHLDATMNDSMHSIESLSLEALFDLADGFLLGVNQVFAKQHRHAAQRIDGRFSHKPICTEQ